MSDVALGKSLAEDGGTPSHTVSKLLSSDELKSVCELSVDKGHKLVVLGIRLRLETVFKDRRAFGLKPKIELCAESSLSPSSIVCSVVTRSAAFEIISQATSDVVSSGFMRSSD